MSLGKRARPPMRRTTSMTEFGFDLSSTGVEMPEKFGGRKNERDNHKAMLKSHSSPSHRNHRKNSGDFVETAPFLRACGLCNRHLGPARDIYMYRGEIAFCSLECRQQQMNYDERKEKWSLTSMNKESPSATGSEASGNGETMVAA